MEDKEKPELDELDLKILRAIKHNARLSFSEIGEQVGVSRVAVKNHMDAMEKRGFILGYDTITANPKKTEQLKFFMDVTTDVQAYDEIIHQFAEYPIFKEIYSTTGECRLHAVGIAPNMNYLQVFMNNLYKSTKGLKRLECHTVLATVKSDELIIGGIDKNDSRDVSKSDKYH